MKGNLITMARSCAGPPFLITDGQVKELAHVLGDHLGAAARCLHKAGEQFSAYANQHAAKGTAEGDQKAAINQQWAQRCFDAHEAALGER